MRDCMSCFTPPDSGIRDISLRKANDREVKNQEGGTNLFFIFSQFTRTDAVDHEIETECIRRFAIAFENGCLGGCAGRWFTTMGPHIGGSLSARIEFFGTKPDWLVIVTSPRSLLELRCARFGEKYVGRQRPVRFSSCRSDARLLRRTPDGRTGAHTAGAAASGDRTRFSHVGSCPPLKRLPSRFGTTTHALRFVPA